MARDLGGLLQIVAANERKSDNYSLIAFSTNTD